MKHINTTTLLGLVLAAAVLAPHGASAAVPAVDNAAGASNVLSISAELNGTLTSTGGVPTVAHVYWGETDGGTAFANWGHTNDLGTNAVGPLSVAVTGLTPNSTYYYRFYATNVDGDVWASATTNFQTLASAGLAPVILGENDHFTLLAASAITTTGGGSVIGDAGVSPSAGSTIGLNAAQVSGTIYAVDVSGPAGSVMNKVMVDKAQIDLTTAYNDAAGRTPIPTGTFLNPGATDGGGYDIGGLSLVPGLYKFDTEAHINTDVTLAGGPDDVWIFQIGTALKVASGGVGAGVKVILGGGAQARNVFWQVGSSATLGTYCDFKGTIMADQAIVLQTGSVLEGRALARIAHIVFDGTMARLPAAAPVVTNVVLTIVSEHGVGLPPVGVYTNVLGATLTNRVSGVELNGGTQYVGVGWSMVGNDPVLGSTTNMVMVHTNDAVLTWLWKTNYYLNASADSNGYIVGSTNGFYAAGVSVTNTATPNLGCHFVGWTGNVTGPTNAQLQIMTMDQARTVVAHFAVDQVTLAIVSEHGVGLPPVGVYTNDYGTTLTNRISGVELNGGTQYVGVGWSMVGNDPALGSTTNMVMVHTNNAVLTWLWSTNYYLNASADSNGYIVGSTNGFYAAGVSVTNTATPNLGCHFVGWTGNVTGPTNAAVQIMTMDQARTVVAHFAVDDEALTLTIVSAHGTGLPPVGVYGHDYGEMLTNSISGVETVGGTQYVPAGWSMTGNAPVAGSGTSMVMTQTNNAVLTWLWGTNYYLNASADSHGSVTGNTNGFYASGSSVSVTAAPDLGYHFAGWTGNVSGSTNSAAQTLTMDQTRTVVAHFASDRLALEIVSEHGEGLPPVGVYTNDYGTTLTNRITGVELNGGTQYVGVGWSMIGNDPALGSTTNMVMVHTNDAVLTWLWSTNYYLNASADSNGYIVGSTNGFYAAGVSVTNTATPNPGCHFVGWTGNVTGPTNAAVQIMTMDQARTVVAHFAVDAEILTLTIVSAHGVGLPPVGFDTHDYGATLTNSISGVETVGGTQYVPAGWSMIGNGPVAGSGTSMVMTQTNNAVLTWLWSTNYYLNASADSHGSVTGNTNGFYASGSSVTVTAAPGLGYHFAGWTGNVSGSTNNLAQTLTMDQARTVVAHFAIDRLALEIVSAHGTGLAPVGLYTHGYGATLTNRISGVETVGGTQYVPAGWSMTGNAPAAGSGTTVVLTLIDDAVLTWLWSTNYYLNASADPHGSVTGNTNGFYASGSSVTVTAVPGLGYHFAGWTGNVSGPTNSVAQTMTMDQARTVVAHFAVDRLTLVIASEHGVGLLPVGVYTNDYGTTLTNRITGLETFVGTQYVAAGWSMIGNGPAAGSTTNMVMTQTNNAVLTWLWSTNYYLTLTATHGSITNATPGWKPAKWVYDLYPEPAFGYGFDHWEVNGVNLGTGVPLNVTMDEAKDVIAHFTPIFVDVTSEVLTNVDWVFDPRKGCFIGTLTLVNRSDSRKSLLAPVWYEVQSTEWHWLRFPTGFDTNTSMHYLDISAAVTSRVSENGNGNQALDPGESVTITGIELMGRRVSTGLVVAVWADPPGAGGAAPLADAGDSDHDGIPNAWEARYPGVLNANNPFDAGVDSDGDGVSNGDEYVAATDPGNPLSLFSIRPVASGRGVTWDGQADRVYTVWAATDLGQGFTVVATNIAGAGLATTYVDNARVLENSSSAIFYRVAVKVK